MLVRLSATGGATRAETIRDLSFFVAHRLSPGEWRQTAEAALGELLGLSGDERAVMCLAVGYPDPEGLVAYSQKKPLGQLRRYNFE